MANKKEQKTGQPPVEEDVELTDNEEQPVVDQPEGSAKVPLETELAQAQEQAKSHYEQYVRTLAEMENLRKRTQREKEELAKYANESILREVLPVVDNLERAVEHAEQAADEGGLLEGVQMTLGQFSQVLSKFGVEPVEAIGQPFDPAFHQAMGQLESAEQAPNTVVQQMQKGYKLNQRLLRPAMVLVAKPPAAPEEQPPAPDGQQQAGYNEPGEPDKS